MSDDTRSIPSATSALRERLGDLAFEVTQNAATERPFTGKYWNQFEDGTYRCICCDALLFTSDTKFDADCGWPSFDRAVEGSVKFIEDVSHGMTRTEVTCASCDAHLGHVFNDGPTETGVRFCINSVSIDHRTPE